MRKIILLCLAVVMATSLARTCIAQEEKKDATDASKAASSSEEVRFFKLDFVVKEIGEDGKVTNSRSYSTMCVSGRRGRSGSIRNGNRVPVWTGDTHQIQYIDLGVNIDVQNVRLAENQLAMDVNAEVSSAVNSQATDSHPDPIIRQNRWESAVLIPLSRATVIFSSDDLSSKGKLQLELTATSVK